MIQKISNEISKEADWLTSFEKIPLTFPVASLQPTSTSSDENRNVICRQGNVCYLTLDLKNSSSSSIAAWTQIAHISDSYINGKEIVNMISCRETCNINTQTVIKGYVQIVKPTQTSGVAAIIMLSFAVPASTRFVSTTMFFLK